MALSHPLLGPAVRGAVQRAATAHRAAPWTCTGFTGLDDRAAHPCGIFHGRPFPVFAKLSTAADAAAQFTAELAGLRLLHDLAGVAVPVPVADGVLAVPPGSHLLLSEALPERPPGARTAADWRSIGRALATLHGVSGPGVRARAPTTTSARSPRTTRRSTPTAGQPFMPNAGCYPISGWPPTRVTCPQAWLTG